MISDQFRNFDRQLSVIQTDLIKYGDCLLIKNNKKVKKLKKLKKIRKIMR